jgi:dTDP-4-dehydrorhamnose reductase
MIWLIGNKGMLGTDIERELRASGYQLLTSDKEIDITDLEALKKYTSGKQIDWIINCSAYTAVDKSEDEPVLAHDINDTGVRNIATVARQLKARLIHFSTDYVFSGSKDSPYIETDAPGPIGAYGKSKLEGEKRIMELLSEYFILRISWLFGIHGNNFVYTMLRLMKEREELRIVSDQWGSPTYTADVAELIVTIVRSGSTNYGIYHYSNDGRINWHQFALEIFNQARDRGLLQRDVLVSAITTDQYPTRATRPMNSYFSKDKITREFNLTIRPWQEALRDFISQLPGPQDRS